VPDNTLRDADIRFETLRASGPGGQHVNKTDSAVRATHLPSGLSVKVQTERSQHANKRLARALLAHKLQTQAEQAATTERTERWLCHSNVERGNATRVFRGEGFVE
jgi:peptide chain release factor